MVLKLVKQNDANNKDVAKDVPEKVEVVEKNKEASQDKTKQDGITVMDENDPNSSETVTGKITRAAKTSQGTFRIIAMTDQALSKGSCDLNFSNGAINLTATAEIVARGNNATCTFELDSAEIAPGKWNIFVRVNTTKDRFGIIEDVVEVK